MTDEGVKRAVYVTVGHLFSGGFDNNVHLNLCDSENSQTALTTLM